LNRTVCRVIFNVRIGKDFGLKNSVFYIRTVLTENNRFLRIFSFTLFIVNEYFTTVTKLKICTHHLLLTIILNILKWSHFTRWQLYHPIFTVKWGSLRFLIGHTLSPDYLVSGNYTILSLQTQSNFDRHWRRSFVDRKFCKYIFCNILIGIVAQSSRLL
jgi:hypothetical protein